MKKIMIDPGHYPGNSNKGQTGYWEYQGTWKISNYLKEFLEKQGITADLTKTYEETFNNDLNLELRGKKAQGYDLFISEHTNANDSLSVRGVEVYYDYTKSQDKVWAEKLSKAVSELMNNSNRGAKIRTYTKNRKILNYYGVIRGASATNCPHIFLIESGFHSNLIDEAFLKNDDNLKKIAEVQARVICKILDVEYVENIGDDNNLSYDKAIDTLKTKVKLDDKTVKYLEDYTYGKDLVFKISQAVNSEEVIGNPDNTPSPTVPIPTKGKVIYKKYSNDIHEMQGEIADLGIKVVDKKIWDINEWTNMVNGTFFYFDKNGKTYSTSPLIIDGVIYQRYCNHNKPQSVFIIYKDNTVALQKVTDVYNIKNFNNIKHAIGGVGLRNTMDSSFKYDPAGEGFTTPYDDVLRKTNKTVIGYNKKHNKIYLLAVKNISHNELIKIISDNSADAEYNIAISVDGGGSVIFEYNKDYIVKGEANRRINNIIGFF